MKRQCSRVNNEYKGGAIMTRRCSLDSISRLIDYISRGLIHGARRRKSSREMRLEAIDSLILALLAKRKCELMKQ